MRENRGSLDDPLHPFSGLVFVPEGRLRNGVALQRLV
jgi:hypothetical protein